MPLRKEFVRAGRKFIRNPYMLSILTLITACKTTQSSSSGKSLQDAWEQVLIPKTSIAVDSSEPVTLTVDNTSHKPTPDSKLSLWTLTLTLEAEGSEDPCDKEIESVETRGERGRLTFVQTDHGEGESTYIYAWKLYMPPVAFDEFIIRFKKNDKNAKTCSLQLMGDGHWEAEGDIGYTAASDNPGRDKALRAYGSTKEHRLKHYLWHTTRGLWEDLLIEIDELKNADLAAEDPRVQRLKDLEKSLAEYKAIGWEPPRYLHASDAETALSGAGEDFLYMHHEMLKEVKAELQRKGFEMVPAWTALPLPEDKDFPVAGPNDDKETLSDAKSDVFYYETQRIWEKAYQSETVNLDQLAAELFAYQKKEHEKTKDTAQQQSTAPTLESAKEQVRLLLEPEAGLAFKGVKGISLSEYGHLLERTIHNNLHTRFQFVGTARPNNADPLDAATWNEEWSKAFDTPNYDWLGDTYSSHVHPWFYRIHGWIDARLQTWLTMNGYKSVGTKEECALQDKPCYVWLSDNRYANKGSDLPWQGPLVSDYASDPKSAGVMQLKAKAHAHGTVIPNFSPDVIRATKGLRAQNSLMNSLLINPELEARLLRKYRAALHGKD